MSFRQQTFHCTILQIGAYEKNVVNPTRTYSADVPASLLVVHITTCRLLSTPTVSVVRDNAQYTGVNSEHAVILTIDVQLHVSRLRRC